MGIQNGQPVNEAYTNPAFLDRRQDDTTIGKVTLANTDPASGSTVTNTQRELNSEASFTGKSINTASNDLPVYTNNQVGAANDDLRTRADALSERFDSSTGHTHDGTSGEGPQIVASDLASVPLRAYERAGSGFSTGTGSSLDISSIMVGKTAGGGVSQVGVVTDAPYNKVSMLQGSGASSFDYFKDADGNIVYGRLTYAASVWTISYYVLIGGTETAYTFASDQQAVWFYQEVFNPMVNPPTFSEFAFLPSDNVTADVITATTTLQGKVSLASSAQSVGSANSAGTANASVANADHAHQGVHSLAKSGDTALYNDITLSAGTAINLVQSGQDIQINAILSGGNVPVGAILAFAGGYFTASNNGGSWTDVLGNTVANVNTYLSGTGFVACDGTELNEPSSPIFNGAGRYLPNLTNSRFIQGSTSAGGIGGQNSTTLTSANLPTHEHTINHTHNSTSFASGGTNVSLDHQHYVWGQNSTGNNGMQQEVGNNYYSTTSGVIGANPGLNHVHGTTVGFSLSGTSGNGGFANTAIENRPLYLNVIYIMRVY